VCAVTIRTRRRHDETTLDQGPTMDAIFIAAHDVIDFGLYPRRSLLADAVALSAQRWDVARVGRRRWHFTAERGVPGVTVLARRCIRIVFREQGSVRTRLIFGDLFGMADTAIHCRHDRFTGAFLGNRHIACIELSWACSSTYRLTVSPARIIVRSASL